MSVLIAGRHRQLLFHAASEHTPNQVLMHRCVQHILLSLRASLKLGVMLAYFFILENFYLALLPKQISYSS